jgi:hypothetical protein
MDTNKPVWIRLKELISKSDVVIEVIDSRDIKGTRIPTAEKMAGSNRLLMVLNKVDLLEGQIKEKLPGGSVQISAKMANADDRRMLKHAIFIKAKDRDLPINVLFIGYPNTGKSTLINMLAGRKVAKVGSIAGTTKDVQWVRVSDDIRATDFRGIFPSRQTKEELVRKGAINTEGIEIEHAYVIGKSLLSRPELLSWVEKELDVDFSKAKNSEDILSEIAKRRNMYIKGGELNLNEAAKALLRKLREAPEI